MAIYRWLLEGSFEASPCIYLTDTTLLIIYLEQSPQLRSSMSVSLDSTSSIQETPLRLSELSMPAHQNTAEIEPHESTSDRSLSFTTRTLQGVRMLSLSSLQQPGALNARARLNLHVGAGLTVKPLGETTVEYDTMSLVDGLGDKSGATYFGIHRGIVGTSRFPFVKFLVEVRAGNSGIVSDRYGVWVSQLPAWRGVRPIFTSLVIGDQFSDKTLARNGKVFDAVSVVTKDLPRVHGMRVEILNDYLRPFNSDRLGPATWHKEICAVSPILWESSLGRIRAYYLLQHDSSKGFGHSLGLRYEDEKGARSAVTLPLRLFHR